MQRLIETIAARKAELDPLRPLAADALRALQKHYDVELTYTSNAIEGNTLTLRETAEVIEHGITVGGKRPEDSVAADSNPVPLCARGVTAGDGAARRDPRQGLECRAARFTSECAEQGAIYEARYTAWVVSESSRRAASR
jgi:hypothetical protein